MKLTFIASTLLSLAAFAAATPTPVNVTVSDSQRVKNSASCKVYNNMGEDEYRLEAKGPWVNDWGRGFLDNIRGQCDCIVFNWKFDYVADKGIASFGITAAARHWCVEDAVWLASNPSGAIWDFSCKRDTTGREVAGDTSIVASESA
ncbi:hypothetical protein FRC18_012124 [Serendipita sp. 400]|nr:hypothetical protein FRC18_012124 [Serendipita sp. 400]